MSQPRVGKQVFVDPEAYWRSQKLHLIAGADEVGRGPLAGPVVAAVVILPPDARFSGLRDSKRLTAGMRTALDAQIREQALAFAIKEVGPRQIEVLGILAASLRAMAQAVKALSLIPEIVLVDGPHPLPLAYPQQPVVKGDDLCFSISAAAVLAKVYRDQLMTSYHWQYPQYNFPRHKGYATTEHLEALRCWGPCPLHRRTFSGVKEWMGQ